MNSFNKKKLDLGVSWGWMNRRVKHRSSASTEMFGGLLSMLLSGIVFLTWAVIMSGCGNVEPFLGQVADVGEEAQHAVGQSERAFWEGKQAAVGFANMIESIEASYGGEAVCITPGLNVGPEYSMTFEIPGRDLIIKRSGEKLEKKVVEIRDFETVNTVFKVKRFASFMESYIVVRTYRNGKPHDMLKEKIGKRYSKEDLTDDSCVAYFIESRDRDQEVIFSN